MSAYPGRWLDLGCLAPLDLHAAYLGLAHAMGPEAGPLLVWAQSGAPHLSVGASQCAGAEIDLEACSAAGVDLVPRPLGGGTVLIDANQYCFFVIVPRRRFANRHAALFDAGLALAQSVFDAHGLPARRVGPSDLWLHGRKILGSGAASVGDAMVFGSSFLLHFDAPLFARLMRSPSAAYREWLVEALEQGMTSWTEHAASPARESLQEALRSSAEQYFSESLQVSAPHAQERAAMAAAAEELATEAADTWCDRGGRRLVANGIKVNHHTYLVETADQGGELRLLLQHGCIARVHAETGSEVEAAEGRTLQAVIGEEPEFDRLRAVLGERLGPERAEYWAQRIARACDDVRRLWHV